MANNKTYTPSVAVQNYEKKAKDYEKQVEQALSRLSSSSLGVAVQDAFNRIQNRLPFSYDLNADGLYQQYKGQYEALGRTAMKETLARAAEKTGGYANSYGVTAGAQAYGAYMEKLNNVIPGLYSLAYERYQNQGKELENQYNLLLARQKQEQETAQDELNRLADLASYYAGRGANLKKEEISLWENALARADALAKAEYQKSRDAVADAQWQKEYNLALQKLYASASKASAIKTQTETPVDEWNAGQWEAYFARIRKEKDSQKAMDALQSMIRSGLIPKDMVVFGVMGAKGKVQGH